MSYKLIQTNQKRSSITTNPHDHGRVDDISGVMHFTCVVKSQKGLHPGTGRLQVREQGVVASSGSRCAGVPSLPGSGFKGAVRTVHEALTGSCAVFGQKPSMTCSREAPCAACCIFGWLGHGGNLGFQELLCRDAEYTVDRVAEGFQGKKGMAPSEYRFYDGTRPKDFQQNFLPQTNPVEVLPQGSELIGSMWFRFLPRLAIGQVLMAMGLGMPRIRLRVGGKKYDAMGHVEIVPTKLVLRTHSALGKAQEIVGAELAEWVKSVAADGLAGTPGAKEVAEQLAKL